MEEIIQMIVNAIHVGDIIQRPQSNSHILSLNADANNNNFIRYSIGQHGNRGDVSINEIVISYNQLIDTNFFTNDWYIATYPHEYHNHHCTPSIIGGIFVRLGIAEYIRPGQYQLIQQ